MITNFLVPAALAFEVQTIATGEEMHWGEMPVTYAWVGGDVPPVPEAERAIRASFATWADITEAFVSVESRTSTLAPAVALDDENLVFFTTDWPEGNEALAITTTWTDDTGAIVQYDVHINATVPWSTSGEVDAYDLQAAITHEVGHVLGIGHSAVVDSTMFAKHEPGDVHRRALHADDVEAAAYLYSEPPAPPDDTGGPLDEGGLACTTAGGVGGAAPAALATLMLLVRLRREEACPCSV